MNPIDYLRGVVRQPITPAPEPTPPREIPWANPAHMTGHCIHDVIYSRCYCHLRKPTPQ